MSLTLSQLDNSYDILVVGAGGAGMSAALFAAIRGARVLLIERTGQVGGTTAFSAGTTWIPNSHHAASVNDQDSPEQARRFLEATVGERAPQALREAFLRHGPEAVAEIESRSAVRYRARPFHPDYESEAPGSTLCGRALEPLPFDGRLLGERLQLVRPPIPEFTVLGGMMVDRDDVRHLLNMKRSPGSFAHACRILGRHALDRLRHGRGTRLVMGNALIASLLYSLDQRQVPILLDCSLENLEREADGSLQVTLNQGSTQRTLAIGKGVILATGGFNRHPEQRQQQLPGIAESWCPGAPGHSGQAHDLARQQGAVYGPRGLSPAYWAPVSLRQRADGSTAAFPHFIMDRGKPGMITVDQAGQRFINESTSYHLFGVGMQQAGNAIPAYLITDAEGLRRYGLGMVRPGGKGLAPFLEDGYLVQGRSLDELASQLEIPAAALQASVARMNAQADSGQDPDFKRGQTAYQQANGDPLRDLPNPNLGRIDTAPFYAVRLYPGDIGAATGLQTDADACLLDQAGQPIPGLYAIGNDMHSIMGGTYPGPGITLGPGLVFASLAVRHALARRDTAAASAAA